MSFDPFGIDPPEPPEEPADDGGDLGDAGEAVSEELAENREGLAQPETTAVIVEERELPAEAPAVPEQARRPPVAALPVPREAERRSELLLDLVAATGLVPRDRLAVLKGERSIVDGLVEHGIVQPEAIAKSLARRHGMLFVNLDDVPADEQAAAAVPLHVLERVRAVPYALEEGVLKIAVADPDNVHGIDELRLATRHPVEFAIGSADLVSDRIRRLQRQSEAFGIRSGVGEEQLLEVIEEEEDDLEVDDGVSDAPLVRLVNSVIFQAAEDGASDIHFEPQEDVLLVRYRIDGVLQELQRVPRRMTAGIITRLKVLAKLDIAERRKPQDGRISLNASSVGRKLDIRVATLPTVDGEKVVMRLLDKSSRPPSLEQLGMSAEMQDALRRIVRRPTGALLVTGPTGSGKSTTLFAALTEINRPEINIITVEDPVEYRLVGVNQVQINSRAGLTFASALRSILRSDPDVVMVGEIRDGETAKISIEAALTGHFVLSTLHTNDAPSALTRLNEMGVEPFLTGAAVTGVLAQRLARKLCTNCCELYAPSAEELLRARVSPAVSAAADGMGFYRKTGCPRCAQTGYKGRIGIYQLLVMSERLEELAATKASREDLERAAVEEGMRTLWDDGLDKVRAGLTSLEELARVTV